MTNNWDAYSHGALYDMIHGKLPDGWEGITARFEGVEPGAGVAGAELALQTWGELAALMDQARAVTELALRDAGASWEGAAAEAMQSGVMPLAQWAADANTAGSATQSSVDGHVTSFSSTQHRMPEPVPITTGMPTSFAEIFAGQTDQDRQEAAAQEAKAEAVRLMTTYEGESTAAAISLGTFVPPPSVTVQVPPPNPTGGEIGSFGGAFAGATGSSGGGGGTRAGTPDSAGSDAGGAPGTTSDAQVTTPGQVVPIGGATPTPGSPPDQVTHRSTTPATPAPPMGTGPIGARSPAGGGSRAPGVPGSADRGGVPNPGRGGAGVPGFPGTAGVRGGAGTTVARGFAGTSMVPLAAVGPTTGDPDRDHRPPAYLRDTHDDFWDDTPKVSPPVIGEEEE